MRDGDLALLGLAMRAGAVIVGTAGVRLALRRDGVRLVVVASDHSKRTEEKVVRLARGRGVEIVLGPPASELGRRLGREAVQALGVTDPRFAKGIGGVSTSRETRRK